MKQPWKLLACVAAGVVGVWLTAKLLLPIGLPFLLGYILSCAAYPMAAWLQKRARFPAWLSSFLTVSFVCLAVIAGLFFLGRFAVAELERLARRLPALFSSLEQPLDDLHGNLLRLSANLPASTAAIAAQWVDRLFEGGSVLAGTVSDRLLRMAGDLISFLPDCLLFLLTTLLSAFFFSSQRSQLCSAVRRRVPEDWIERFHTVCKRLKTALGGYFKAQLWLTGVTFSILTVGLLLLRVPNAPLTALIIAVIDALPVFGSGTVLIPWSLITLLRGETSLAVGLLLLYAAAAVSRAILEPRFLGRQIGMHPLLTLLSLYAGFRLFGVMGMILLPIGAILLKQLYDLVEAAE
ncbi:MAG: sporulation integral membrane protein YtvI [Oscillospiraceae bacterium]|nr:sporulation integral membrane protein YtvI [Oscillospiraceae bacterium]